MGMQGHYVLLQTPQRGQAQVLVHNGCVAPLLHSQAELCPGTMPSEKSGHGYPVYVRKSKRAFFLGASNAVPFGLCAKEQPLPWLISQFHFIWMKHIFYVQCFNCSLFCSSTSYVAPRLFLGGLVALPPHQPSPGSALLSRSHSDCWISLGITQYCFIKRGRTYTLLMNVVVITCQLCALRSWLGSIIIIIFIYR